MVFVSDATGEGVAGGRCETGSCVMGTGGKECSKVQDGTREFLSQLPAVAERPEQVTANGVCRAVPQRAVPIPLPNTLSHRFLRTGHFSHSKLATL